MKIFVETDRLILREILPSDADGFFELDSDPDVHKYLGNKPVTSISQVKEVIQLVRQQYIDNGIGRWAVVEKCSNSFIGWAGLKYVREATNNHINYYDLGYRLIKKYWAKGFATESAIASLNYGFENLNLSDLYAIAHQENNASNRILSKVGFHLSGTFMYDNSLHNWYKLTKRDWVKKNNQFISH
ncbi:MAG: GNAT family N-acetyltransferase [Bacteroidetes bacterium]|nr:GNAT family N-acetyltransferase [Bacteroidota bacterium]